MKHLTTILAGFCLLIGMTVSTQSQELPKKKLIQYGWDYRYPDYIRENIREMEKRPFDGIIFRLKGFTAVFQDKPWDEQSPEYQKAYDDCKNIEWSKFKDNFIIIGSTSSMDWFDDTHWEAARNNLRMVLKAAVAARCRGICFDPEAYGASPWSYWTQLHAKEKSFREYEAKARERGVDFARVIQEEMPAAVFHTFYLFCLYESLADDPSPQRRENRLAKHSYGLYQAFLNGILDAASPSLTITDGNEYAYYYRSPAEYYEAYYGIRQRFLSLVAPENRSKYRTQVQVSQALYPDYIFARGGYKEKRLSPAAELSPEDQALWFEHNVYYGLRTTDEFVWLYNEDMNWWDGKGLPDGMETAIVRARARVLKGEPLGYEMTEKVTAAEQERKKKMQSATINRSADIAKVKGAAPAIDGNPEEAFWQAIQPLEPFMAALSQGKNVANPETIAKIAYDEENLYLLVQCAEPNVKKMRAVESPIWVGDCVDLLLSRSADRTPYAHLIVNPDNVQWSPGEKDKEGAPEMSWRSATSVTNTGWTVEMAISWKELRSQPPTAGEKRFANVARHRAQEPRPSSWSQVMSHFHEPETFGVWTFR